MYEDLLTWIILSKWLLSGQFWGQVMYIYIYIYILVNSLRSEIKFALMNWSRVILFYVNTRDYNLNKYYWTDDLFFFFVAVPSLLSDLVGHLSSSTSVSTVADLQFLANSLSETLSEKDTALQHLRSANKWDYGS